jgi:hypothetical protein
MSVMLAIMAFILILIGVAVQVTHHNVGVKFAVTWSTLGAAAIFLLFAGKVYFT